MRFETLEGNIERDDRPSYERYANGGVSTVIDLQTK
jgi:hypothetical protein